jgi:hypothetical protein
LGCSLGIGAPGSHVPHGSLNQDRAVYLPATAQPVSRSPLDFVADRERCLLSMAFVYFPTAHQRFTCVRLPRPYLMLGLLLPATTRLTGWYAGCTWWTVVTSALLTGYGVYYSTGRRPFGEGALLKD